MRFPEQNSNEKLTKKTPTGVQINVAQFVIKIYYKYWNISLNTEICWLPHTPRINDCICLIEFALRCIYIEDDNKFIFSTEINKGWKPEVDIEEVKSGNGLDK